MKAWPKVALGDLLRPSEGPAVIDTASEYYVVSIKLWDEGIVSRGKPRGSDVVSVRLVVPGNQLIRSKMDARLLARHYRLSAHQGGSVL